MKEEMNLKVLRGGVWSNVTRVQLVEVTYFDHNSVVYYYPQSDTKKKVFEKSAEHFLRSYKFVKSGKL